MTEYVRQNKMCRYGDKNLSEVKKKKVLVQNENRNQDVPLAKNLFKVNNRTPVQGMKSVKRYQQRHQNDIKTMLWWFYCQPQMLSTHSSNATFFYSKQKNAGNVNIV